MTAVKEATATCRNCGKPKSEHIQGISGRLGCWNNSASTTFQKCRHDYRDCPDICSKCDQMRPLKRGGGL